ncbi:hypothetical protein BDF19DRAFT_311419 [Syncephalis fuscata]|nr:hypothetical protein BDF19DRAFT_311419 [Syncephalis fuscata]
MQYTRILTGIARQFSSNLNALSPLLLDQAWYQVVTATNQRFPAQIRKCALQLAQKILDAWVSLPIITTTMTEPYDIEMQIQKTIDQYLLVPLHQLILRGSIHNLLPLGEEKTVKDAIFVQFIELFAHCTWAMVRRRAKSWESFLFDYSRYSLMIIADTKTRCHSLLIYLNHLLALDNSLLTVSY